ncbi:MAG: DUF503 domain-containing protein [bacterium]|nr:DUF503 domain-containing protein [bacterium]
MIVGICQIVLYLPDSGSLKQKRSLLKSLITRVRNKFNVSVSEVGDQDLWQKAQIGVAVVTNDTRYANQVLSQVVNLVERQDRLELIDYTLEML